jgi:hypothetical protein
MTFDVVCVPTGATHFSTTYEYDAPMFWRRRFTHYNTVNEERLQPMYVLQHYWMGHWIDDPIASPRRFQPIELINVDTQIKYYKCN